MADYPYKSGSVCQIHPQDGWGWADCSEASAVRLLREAGKMDPMGDHLAQINEVCLAMRGVPDSPNNGNTYSNQIISGPGDGDPAHAGLAGYGIKAHWSDSYQEAHDTPWALVVVNNEPLQTDGSYAYDPGALGGDSHVCLWMPSGAINDPLSCITGKGDVHWDYGSLQSVFVGAIIIDTQVGPAWPPLPPPPPPKPPVAKRRQTKQQVGLKGAPAHGGPDLVTIPAGAWVLDSGNRKAEWASVLYGIQGKAYWGWILAAALQ